ncbi:MAG: hypothetical protein JSV15_06925 [Candidatus Bathyarchaeota archaeon]|nr:MAG: hypothetical protein JSV15_06925 [Candidatus Bathyarchaeota archaeon]
MGKTYQCPYCGGTEMVWDRGLGKTACPKDRTLVDSYKIASLESMHPTIKKKTAESRKTTQKKTEKGKTTTKKTKRKKKSS